jgi:2-keto-4-pentenoate hydratase
MTKPDTTTLQQVADALREARDACSMCAPVRELLGDVTPEDAYAVQELNTERWLKEGRRAVGRKIGLTSVAIQKQLGVDQPDYGMLYADMAVADGEEIALGRLIQPKVEGEIAFYLGDDLDGDGLTSADVMAAVDYVVAAVEVVDSRVKDWDIRLLDTIADNASSGVYVLGSQPRKLPGLDLRLCGMVMEHKGEPVSVGAGAACLGNPLTATLWLARKMVEVGRPLKKGDLVLSGALGPMVTVEPGAAYECRISGLGGVHVNFSG